MRERWGEWSVGGHVERVAGWLGECSRGGCVLGQLGVRLGGSIWANGRREILCNCELLYVARGRVAREGWRSMGGFVIEYDGYHLFGMYCL